MTILEKIRNGKFSKALALYLSFSMLFQVFSPNVALALTSGPSQPEVQSFEPVSTSDMVDLFTGDFNYNLPLFELPGPNGGYPFNIAYHGGVEMDQEASWVGLGWNLNPGAVTREMRGLPDDFDGDAVVKTLDMRASHTFGIGYGANLEIFGGDGAKGTKGFLAPGAKLYYNNMKGLGYSLAADFSMNPKNKDKGIGMGLSLDSQEGVGVSAKLSMDKQKEAVDSRYSSGIGFSSKRGLSLSLSKSAKNPTRITAKRTGMAGGGSSFSFSERAYTPFSSPATASGNLLIYFKQGFDVGGTFLSQSINGFYNIERLRNKNKAIAFKAYGYNYLEDYSSETTSASAYSLGDYNREKDGTILNTTPNLAIPSLTYDYFSVLGQGMSGMFRPFRNEYGRIEDPAVSSWGAGGSFGFEFGSGAPIHLGTQFAVNYNISSTSAWNDYNDWYNYYTFRKKNSSQWSAKANAENLYYKLRGEATSYPLTEMAGIGGDEPVRAYLNREVHVNLSPNYNPSVQKLQNKKSEDVTNTTSTENDRITDHNGIVHERISRNSSIQPITNRTLTNGIDNVAILGEYKVKYCPAPIAANQLYNTSTNFSADISRMTYLSHNAGVTSVNPDGVRYVYGLPVYNNKKVETTYTVSDDVCAQQVSLTTANNTPPNYAVANTDQYFSKTETPAYAYSYLLTSVLGNDYVDINNNGPGDEDPGYWIKFNYTKIAPNYKWRAPFIGANLDRGEQSILKDNKASFTYGEKDIFNMATVESRTHIAIFHKSKRMDARAARYEYNGVNPIDNGTYSYNYKLDSISLYSKEEYKKYIADNNYKPIPVKRVHFEYSYDLCGNVPNNDGTAIDKFGNAPGTYPNINTKKGKLTLKKVWFTYQNNYRGELSPYTFNYNENIPAQNPDYSVDYIDRWGGYKSRQVAGINSLACSNGEHPYVPQFSQDVTANENTALKAGFKSQSDIDAAVWSLKQIALPSGGSINMTYESDDYAYVQHKKATQMYQVQGLLDMASNKDIIYQKSGWNSTNVGQRRVYFKLEKPIPTATGDPVGLLKEQYINDLYKGEGGSAQLYFKLKVKVRQPSENIMNYVSGYAEIDESNVGVDAGSSASIDGVTCYTRGYITLKLPTINGSTINYHPLAFAAWQQLRTNTPDILNTSGNIDGAGTNAASAKALKVKSLIGWLPSMLQMFGQYRAYCFNRSWASQVDLTNSFIRLGSADKVKFGGGARIKKIVFNDSWSTISGGTGGNTETSSDYGQVYDYTTLEANAATGLTETISSGVAQYEPMIGGDENPLKRAKIYPENIPCNTDNQLFTEYPINESYFPGPVVGYSKVTVRSLASYQSGFASGNPENPNNLPPGIITTGITEQEFYTAREFPVIADETDAVKKPYFLYIPLPFIGEIQVQNMTAAQGYSVELNDMHGRLKKVTNYAKDINGNKGAVVSSIEYKYQSKPYVLSENGKTYEVKQVDSKVKVLRPESIDANGKKVSGLKNDGTDDALMGMEYEFFTDQRKSHSFSMNAGLDFNLEITIWPFPCPWPSFSTSTYDTRTVVTNKIIHRAAILTETVAKDGQSTVTTNNKLFDSQTGRSLLTTVTNDFERPIYNYEMPAMWAYDGMGAAYKNHMIEFSTIIPGSITTGRFSINSNNANAIAKKDNGPAISYDVLYDQLQEGDVFIVEQTFGKILVRLVKRKQYLNTSSVLVKELEFYSDNVGALNTTNPATFSLVTSGRKNLLNTNSGTIASVTDPTDNTNHRFLETLTSSAQSMYTMQSEVDELASLLSMFLVGGQVPHTDLDMNDPTFATMFPLHSAFFSSISFECLASTSYVYNFWGRLRATGELFTRSVPISGSGTISYIQRDAVPLWVFIKRTPGTGTSFSTACASSSISPKLTYIDSVINSSSANFSYFWDYDNRYAQGSQYANLYISELGTQYANGKKGTWRPYKNFYYKDERYKNTASTAGLRLKHDGVFDGDGTNMRYYMYTWAPSPVTPLPVQWIPRNLITRYNSSGFETENRDILGVYSGAVYGYNNSVPVAVGANAQSKELYFESFDDPSGTVTITGSGVVVSTDMAHTGMKSLKVPVNVNQLIPLNTLSIIPGKNYVISMWMARTATPTPLTYADASTGVYVEYYTSAGASAGASSPVIQPSGRIVEGWQRIEATLSNIPSTTAYIIIKFNPGVTSTTSYFDDIRIFPSDGNIQTYVYDPVTYRLSAVLDDNNFATLYNYNESGELFLVKKETANGIKTRQESGKHLKE